MKTNPPSYKQLNWRVVLGDGFGFDEIKPHIDSWLKQSVLIL